jgi:hypothetical protein
VAAIPASQSCTGAVAGQDNVCLVRCQNDARAGPFGGVIPVQMAAAGGNATENAAAARRAFALKVRETELTLSRMMKKRATFDEDEEEEDEE